MKKIIAIVCGGYSGEAQISLNSAQMILENIDRSIYDPIKTLVEKNGFFAIIDGERIKIDLNDFSFQKDNQTIKPDIALIIVHGTPGEDGKLQGYFDLIGMPYTTGSVLNTSLTFSKYFTNQLLKYLGFNSAQGLYLRSRNDKEIQSIESKLSFPVIVKPNEGGSSIGISLVTKNEELENALTMAFDVNDSVLVEEFIEGPEYSCGVIPTKNGLQALAVTEIKTQKAFFDYKAKYEYDQTEEITPAQLDENQYNECQKITLEIYKHFNCSGVARVDYLLKGNKFYVIEINTVPGLSEKSIVPQQAEAVGINRTDLISLIIQSALS